MDAWWRDQCGDPINQLEWGESQIPDPIGLRLGEVISTSIELFVKFN
jgi:hypothetical protein